MVVYCAWPVFVIIFSHVTVSQVPLNLEQRFSRIFISILILPIIDVLFVVL